MNENQRSDQLSLAVRAPQAHPHKPSPRNVEIFSRVREHGERQEEVAKELGISRVRVAQICKQVEDWRQWTRERQHSAANPGEWVRTVRQLTRRRTQLLFAMAVRGLAAAPYSRPMLKVAVQLSASLAQQEEGLPMEERLAATAVGKQLEEMLLAVVAKLFPAAREEYARTKEPGSQGGPGSRREAPNVTYLMHATEAKMHANEGNSTTDASGGSDKCCGELAAPCGTVMHDKPGK